MSKALDVSSIALAMKTIYTSIKQRTPARVTIHDFPLELQLPPYLSLLLHSSSHTTNSNANPTSYDSDSDYESSDSSSDEFEHGEVQAWSEDMQFAWRLPALTPWKSLLRLDDNEQMYELHMKLRGPQLAARDRELAEQLIRFLDQASITLRFVPFPFSFFISVQWIYEEFYGGCSLADMASLLDWDLKLHVYPTVRWLVHHRRAKLVDMVHPTLKTVFSVPARLPAP